MRNPPRQIPSATHSPALLRAGFWICVVIAVAAVVRRLFALAIPAQGGPPPMVALDQTFSGHTALTISHIVPAMLFVLVSPFAVLGRFASLRWPSRILFPLGIIVGLTAYAMNVYAVGGWIERIAILLFNTLFLYSLVRAWRFAYVGDGQRERRWLLRSVAILLGIATARPVMGVFFATSSITHLAPSQFFGIAMWIGFTVNLLVFEVWIRLADRRTEHNRTATFPAARPAGY